MRVIDLIERAQTITERLSAVVAANDHRVVSIRTEPDTRSARILPAPCLFEDAVCFFGAAIPRHQPEFPIEDLLPPGKPLIRPREKDGAGRPAFHDAFEVPAKDLRLHRLALTPRIESEFAEDQRLFFREILQPREVTF